MRFLFRKYTCTGNQLLNNNNNKIFNIVGTKFKCYFCEFMFDDLNLLERHCKLSGECNKIYNNIYKFYEIKLGKYIYSTLKYIFFVAKISNIKMLIMLIY